MGTRAITESDDPRTKRLYKDEPIRVFNFFADEFFGIERTIAQIVRYFHSASLKGEESRQVLYLMGPVQKLPGRAMRSENSTTHPPHGVKASLSREASNKIRARLTRS